MTPFFDPNIPIGFWKNNLPHWEQYGKIHFVNFRLRDSLPQSIVRYYKQIKESFLRSHPYLWSKEVYEEYNKIINRPIAKYVDAGYGSCILKEEQVRKYLIEALDFFDNERYLIYAYVIMPNHVHLLIAPCPGYELKGSLDAILSYAARNINKYLNKKDRLWSREPFDTIIRSAEHYAHTLDYIKRNPIGLQIGSYSFGGLEFQNKS